MTQFTDDLSPENFGESLDGVSMSPEDFEAEVLDGTLGLGQNRTGLKYFILLDSLGKTLKKKHTPRLFIDVSGNFSDVYSVSIDEFNPKLLVDKDIPDFESVADWIKKNYPVLIRHWNQEIDDWHILYLLPDETEEHKDKIRQLRAERIAKYGATESLFDKFVNENREELEKLKQLIHRESETEQNDN